MRELVKMDMRTAVLYAERKIEKGKVGFIVSTEFGKIGIEVNGFEDENPLHPVDVLPWKEAPATTWCMQNAEKHADYYVSISTNDSELLRHIAVIEAFTRCIFMKFCSSDVDDDVVDAAVGLFVDNYDERKVTVNSLENEFCITCLNVFERKSLRVRNVVRELIQVRMTAAEKVAKKSKEMLIEYQKTTNVDGEFHDMYCRELYGIMLYLRNEQKIIMDDTTTGISQFELDEKSKQKSISVNRMEMGGK